MKYVVSKFNDDGSIYPVYECEDEEEAMKTAYACNGVYEKASPSLTDDQQVVLEWLKLTASTGKPMQVVFLMVNNAAWGHLDELRGPLMELTDKQQFEVLAAFAQWGLEQEEA